MSFKKKIELHGRFATPEDVEAQIAREEAARPLNLKYIRRETKGKNHIGVVSEVLVSKIISTGKVVRKTEIGIREMVKTEERAPQKGRSFRNATIGAARTKLKVRAKDDGRRIKKLTSGAE
jgi:hypothetical protein